MTEQQLLPVEHLIADYLLSLIPPGRPRRLARMSYAGETKRQKNKHTGQWETVERGKYEDISGPLTRAMLVEHAAGTITYSYMLDLEGKARAGAFDVDNGGHAALVAALGAAAELGITAFAIVLPGEQHDGGHVWALYDTFYDALAIKAQMQQIVKRAGLETGEIWPGYKQGIRPPFGKHQVKGTRGTLILQSGEVLDLDTDLAEAFTLVEQLPTNSAPPPVQTADKMHYAKSTQPVATTKKECSTAGKVIRLTSGRLDTAAIFAEARAQFNADHTWDALLSEYGGTEVQTGYWACNCGVAHTHNIQIAITSQGKIISLSNRCGWARDDKALDQFGFWCDQEHKGNYRAAAEAAARQYGLWVESEKAKPEQPDTQYRAPSQDAQRKRAQRLAARNERLARIDPLIDQLDQDSRIYPFARDLFAYHLACWSSGPEHYASIERITRDVLGLDRAPTENEYRRVQLAHQRLIECAYLKRTIRGSSATKETNCWQPGSLDGHRVIRDTECATAQQEAKSEGRITLIITSNDLYLESLDLVSAAPSPYHENVYASTLDDWGWSEVEHSADELTMLDHPPAETAPAQQEAAQAPAPVLDRCDPNRYEVEGIRYNDTGREMWRLWDATADQLLGEYGTEAEAIAATWAKIEQIRTEPAHTGESAPVVEPQKPQIAVFDDSDEPEIASFSAVELPRHKPYSGITKHTQDTEARYTLVWESMRRIDHADECDQGETVNFTDIPTPKPRRAGDKPRAIDRYVVELAGMSESELAGELRKHKATLKKHAGKVWLSSIRDRLLLVEREIDARELHAAAPGPRPLTSSPARRQAPASSVQGAFL